MASRNTPWGPTVSRQSRTEPSPVHTKSSTMADPAMLTDSQKAAFKDVTDKNYRAQAIFFLNAYWDECEEDAEKIRFYLQLIQDIDEEKGADGTHVKDYSGFLRKSKSNLTAVTFKTKMRGVDLDYNNQLALAEFLIFNYEKQIPEMLSKSDKQEVSPVVQKAQKAVLDVQAEVAALKAKEADLRAKADGGGVKATMAKQQLEAFLADDKTDLSRGIISTKSAVRNAQKNDDGVCRGLVWFLQHELDDAKEFAGMK
eukprot:227226_1